MGHFSIRLPTQVRFGASNQGGLTKVSQRYPAGQTIVEHSLPTHWHLPDLQSEESYEFRVSLHVFTTTNIKMIPPSSTDP